MSTKTSIKRIALVAVSALGFGLMSVAPARAATAAYVTVLGTVTPSVPTVGTAITIPLKLTLEAATENAVGAPTFTAAFDQKPVNTSLVNTDLVANVTGSELATAGAALAVASAATNVITVTTPATDIDAFTAQIAGNFVFTPDQPGHYEITITASAGTDTATEDIVIVVGGASLTQSSSGKGAATGNAIINGSAVAAFTVRAGTAAATRFNVTSTGVGSLNNGLGCVDQSAVLIAAATAVRCSGTAVGTVATINGTNYAAGFSYTSGAAITSGALTGASKSEQFTFDMSSSEAGTQTVTITEIALATGIPTVRATVTINWVASTSTNASTQYSTVYMNAGTTLASSANDDTVAGVNCLRTGVTQCANILVTIKDVNNVALNQASLSATITGPGLMGLAVNGTTANTAQSGRVVATSSTSQLTNNAGVISVWSDGTSGTATITISSGTVVLATKSIIFYGTVATLTATQNLKVARASAAGAELGCNDAGCTWLTTATTPAVYIVAKDASGSVVPGLTVTALSNNSAVIISGSVVEDDATAGDGPGYYNASVTSAPGGTSGASGTVVFRTLLSTGAYVSTEAITFTLGGTVATATLTLDKDSYQAGEAMVVTRTAKDSAGNPVYDGVASPAVLFSKAIGGTAPAAGEYSSGVSASSATRPTVFAPSTGGAFEARATFSFAGVSTQVTATATVEDDASTAAANAASDAASEAIDAANAATDAANLAAEAADAATVAAEEARDSADAATAAVE
ncbi:MAG: hypothetical protein O2896_03500, partial [Actinomycetota bacterium]|nr:hypothetical protein [Actinomycetota bacterium]